jgi:hypothetical protein
LLLLNAILDDCVQQAASQTYAKLRWNYLVIACWLKLSDDCIFTLSPAPSKSCPAPSQKQARHGTDSVRTVSIFDPDEGALVSQPRLTKVGEKR